MTRRSLPAILIALQKGRDFLARATIAVATHEHVAKRRAIVYTRPIMWRLPDSVWALIALSSALIMANGSARAAGDPAAGQNIVRGRCAQCHLVDGGRARGAAPPLPTIARDASWTDDRLAAFLTQPHGGVRGFAFSRQEIDNLVAYIRSLEPE